MKRLVVLLFICALSLGAAGVETKRRLSGAVDLLNEMMNMGDSSIPQELIDKSECAIIVPGLKSGGFIFGAKYGRGFFTCRKPDKIGWTAPGAVRIEGGSFGLQIGVAEKDLILLVMNDLGRRRLLSSRFSLGGDVTAAAGPVGRTSSAQTDAYMSAAILSWSRARGAFAGVALQGSTIRQDLDVNEDLHGKRYSNRDILEGNLEIPADAQQMVSLLNKISSRK